jgi:hypothetical protein
VPLDRNAKVRVMMVARALGAIILKMLDLDWSLLRHFNY